MSELINYGISFMREHNLETAYKNIKHVSSVKILNIAGQKIKVVSDDRTPGNEVHFVQDGKCISKIEVK